MSDTGTNGNGNGSGNSSGNGAVAPDLALLGLGTSPDGQVLPEQTDNGGLDDEVIRRAFGLPDGEQHNDDDGDNNNGDDDDANIDDDEVNTGAATGEQGSPPTIDATGDSSFATLFKLRYGREPTQSDLDSLFELTDWTNNLTPEQVRAIEYAQQNVGVVNGQQQQQSIVQSPQVDELEEQYADDPLYQRLKALESEHQQLIQQQVQNQQQAAVAQISAGADTFRQQFPDLSDTEFETLQGAVTSAGIFPAFVQSSHGNIQLAMHQALEAVFWRTPEFRDAEMGRRLGALKVTEEKHEVRKTKAGSVTGTGGNGASRTEAPKQNLTADDRWAAVAAGIREAQNNGAPA